MRRLQETPRSKRSFTGRCSSRSKRQCGRHSGCVLIIEDCRSFARVIFGPSRSLDSRRILTLGHLIRTFDFAIFFRKLSKI